VLPFCLLKESTEEEEEEQMNLSEPGVGDFILLNDVAEESFMENLEKRFLKNRIYVRDTLFSTTTLGRIDS